ncbi:uncharacterized protein N7483_008727 [Penicillium malachiteum]|uniref:uncharacterized protein n=1 Tax=Penicillium malachiteum TaxID=1324776 RepID=UPI002547930E|nr:uncharacterized protein N7483_008727 [Penicillium malachiteum]KAJ5720793.1 hypothetical protein N7483_008727 [Penicillium malachiteum]
MLPNGLKIPALLKTRQTRLARPLRRRHGLHQSVFLIPVRYPTIAVVVPSPSPPWRQGATRTSTSAAAAVCKKRLRSGRGTGKHQDANTTCDKEQPYTETFNQVIFDSSDSSIPVSSHCSGAIQGIRGNALLTVESHAGLKPAYFFTFVPDPSPMLSQPHTAIISGKQRRYTSDENALLVRLKEKRGNVMARDYGSLPRSKYVISSSPLFNQSTPQDQLSVWKNRGDADKRLCSRYTPWLAPVDFSLYTASFVVVSSNNTKMRGSFVC